MQTKNLVISTICLAISLEEEILIGKSLEVLSSRMIAPIIVVDGGSSKGFIEQLRAIKNAIVIEKKEETLFKQFKESLQTAVKQASKYIFYTECNKLDFFTENVVSFVEQTLKTTENDPDFGIALPSRTKKSFATFPSFQRYEENITNELLTKFMKEEKVRDYTYGPRIISSSLVSTLEQVEEDLGWGWMSFILLAAKRLGKNIYSFPLDLNCPIDERDETFEDKNHRLKQLEDHIRAIRQANKLYPLEGL